MHVALTNDASFFSFCATFVYAKCVREDRQSLWSCLRQLDVNYLGPKLWGGDFNVVAKPKEYIEYATLDSRTIMDFTSCIQDCCMMELPFFENTFTWTGT
ncbi:hypothetical protein ACH5RR_029531 [Cinchona calisaya]|uniref:Uncharacterized protein n=1 Tax=Cinchona calisaya TaxID=153742 RepID=A0ABD2YVS3_9GENT